MTHDKRPIPRCFHRRQMRRFRGKMPPFWLRSASFSSRSHDSCFAFFSTANFIEQRRGSRSPSPKFPAFARHLDAARRRWPFLSRPFRCARPRMKILKPPCLVCVAYLHGAACKNCKMPRHYQFHFDSGMIYRRRRPRRIGLFYAGLLKHR